MIESEHMSDLHVAEEHMVDPTFDQRAVELYELLRKSNPWLPDPHKVLASSDMDLSWGGFGGSSLRLTVAIDLPKGIVFSETP